VCLKVVFINREKVLIMRMCIAITARTEEWS